ncbi:SDR family NAD(P)-dependent oxidoreductase [Shinella sp.]|uniref:SDR family NAD(P)-dependent oxidoreductase n=1 Tax=Shinella sp. TaxID=1870904 RepID=UPI0029B12378|nr:SDR family NAD(P)-dependent oxidoreductase [Shinella sp.]MDX3974710.1 SDR family NAD(P)-dependent oxidoreductase [Shinella sp.]
MYAELFRLDGRVALVTGGSRGIGLACAEALGEAGARIAISARSRDEGEKAVRHLAGKGIEALYLPADISSESAAQAVVKQAAAELGGLDILVNNAGIARHGDSLDVKPETWDEVINTNLTGLFWCCRAAIETMVAAGRGSIVNIGSISGYISNLPQNQVAYNASKAGVHMLTKSLAGEFAKNNIRINAVAPGYIETAMTQGGLDDPEWSKIWLGMTPMGRTGKPSDVAAAVLYLASDAASYVTGSVLTIDGGYTIH